MRAIKLIIFFVIITNVIYGQSQKSFDKLISETNKYLSLYSELPYTFDNEYIPFKESGLSDKEIAYIKEQDYADEDGYFNDSVSKNYLILGLQDLIFKNIKKIISNDKFKENNIKDLLLSNPDFNIVVSNDKKLYNFILDEKTGGTYHSKISLMYYTGISVDSLKTQREIEYSDSKNNPYSIFDSNGFDAIYSIKTKEGTKYVLTSYTETCFTCLSSLIMLVKFKDGRFFKDFEYYFTSRNEQEDLTYNPKSNTIVVNYITDDVSAKSCICNSDSINKNIYSNDDDGYYIDEDESDESNISANSKICKCIFIFNGLNFELSKKSLNKIK